MNINQFNDLSDESLWLLYANAELELKNRGLVRTRNIVGERGEFLAIDKYNSISGLPKLQAAPEGTQNVDALSRKGERYSIKTISVPGTTTGVFHGCGDKDDPILPEKKFEYVIIVQIAKNYKLKRVIELNWEQFLKFRKWHSTMRAWNINVTNNLINEARTVFVDNA